MKPLAILQHDADVAPGYFGTWLQEQGIPAMLIRIDRGAAVPSDAQDFCGICSLGGRMSVNDPLPWIDEELRLMRAADAVAVPVIGHCLGGQLLAKAFGATVRRHSEPEIGWCELEVTEASVAQAWLGEDIPSQFPIFQWHQDSFAIPDGARNFLRSTVCANQAFVIDRGTYAHLGMQFHCEMTPQLIELWSEGEQNATQLRHDAVQKTAQAQQQVAQKLYQRWTRGLRL